VTGLSSFETSIVGKFDGKSFRALGELDLARSALASRRSPPAVQLAAVDP
jgi:hypothetical protein